MCFLVSIIWNWVYMYKVKKSSFSSLAPVLPLLNAFFFFKTDEFVIPFFSQTAFAEHHKNMAKLDGISEKCTGVKKIEWSDSLKGEPFTSLNVHYTSWPLL